MSELREAAGVAFPARVDLLVIGAGACGLSAALAAAEAGAAPLVIEADPAATGGSTALSAGLIPAAGTRWQAAAGVADDPDAFAADIMRKAEGEPEPALVARLAAEAAPTLHWLADRHGLPVSLAADIDYPGHSRRRMHGLPTRAGRELADRLRRAAETAGIDILFDRRATALYADAARRVAGVAVARPDGVEEILGCRALLLACNGFGGNRELVRAHMPEIADALWFGHDGNRGDALVWGAALGAGTRHLGAYQGHGSVADPGGVLITWAIIGAGGLLVNAEGRRFGAESLGYSEAARVVLAQPGGVAWMIFDDRIAAAARRFADFRAAESAGLIREAADPSALAETLDVSADALAASLAERAAEAGALSPPYRAARVTGALFHTQGGLATTQEGRVLLRDGRAAPNLWAAGGAACGVSGSGDRGYLSGNGLLSAVVLGRLAGRAAGRFSQGARRATE